MHNIKYVAQATGLSAHTIRAWERRYTALSPDRTVTNRRLYTNEDVDKLRLLSRGLQAGHSIGRIAHISLEELVELLPKEESASEPQQLSTSDATAVSIASFLEQCSHAIDEMEGTALADTLTRASAVLGTAQLIDRLLIPLLQNIGERWRDGSVRISQEHMASAIIRTYLGRTLAAFQPSTAAPCLIVATPMGQFHELGALMAGVTAALQGWRILYLGTNLPAVEIAGAVHRTGAKAVALSIIYPPDDPRLAEEIEALRQYVCKEITLLVGGRDSTAYGKALERAEVVPISDMRSLRNALERIRLL